MELFKATNIDFLGHRKKFFVLSLVLFVVGSATMIMRGGPRLGIDFKGGTLVYVKFAEAPDLNRLRASLREQGLGSSTLQRYGHVENYEVIIGAEQAENEDEALDTSRQAILAALRATYEVPANRLNLNAVGTASLREALVRLDPIGLSGRPTEAASRYQEIARNITDFRDTQRGGLLGSLEELRGLEGVPPAVVNGLAPPRLLLQMRLIQPAAAGQTHRMTSTAFGATKTAKVNGTTLAYREQGEGEPVLFVHGGISDLRTWEQQLPAVGRSYRAIT